MTEFWRNLDWPDLIDGLPMAKKLTDDVCSGAVMYADLMHEKLKQAGYYDEEGQFDVTEQVKSNNHGILVVLYLKSFSQR